MDETGFRKTLKKFGKKEHVIDGLVNQVRTFETYLNTQKQVACEAAGEEDIAGYIDSLPKGQINTRIRGIAYYYHYLGNEALARMVSGSREKEIAKSRHIFKLSEFRGVDQAAVKKLEEHGIITVQHMLEAGKTLADREELAWQLNIPPQTILELVKLSDLSRLGALKSVRARLYYEAGLDTPDQFTWWEADDLRKYLVEWVQRSGFDGIAPLAKEIQNAINAARKLPGVIEY